MDIDRFSLIVGLLALALAIPLAVTANLITPRVRDWYSTTSLKRLQKRIVELRAKLAVSEGLWTFTPGEWQIQKAGARRAQSSAVAVFAIFYLILGAVTFGASCYLASRMTNAHLPMMGKVLTAFFLLFAATTMTLYLRLLIYEVNRHYHNREMHSIEGRDYLKSEIDKLTAVESRFIR